MKVVFKFMEEGKLKGITSTLTISEIMTKPYKENNKELIHRYMELFKNQLNLFIVDVDQNIALKAAQLHAKYNFKTYESIFIATGIVQKTDSYITTDNRFTKIEEFDIAVIDFFLDK